MKFLIAKDTQNLELTREHMGRNFANGFYHWLKIFHPNAERLAQAFAHIFSLDAFYVAIAENGDVLAQCALRTPDMAGVGLQKKPLCKHLGFLRGSMAYWALNKHLLTKYPQNSNENIAYVEFVATSVSHRGKGIASELINFAMQDFSKREPVEEYILEVADTNEVAVRLYSRLGFSEYHRKPSSNPRRTGLNFFVYMKKSV